MSYTHSFDQLRDFDNNEWRLLCDSTRIVLSNLPEHSESAGGYYREYPLVVCGPMGNGEPTVDQDRISLNGKDGEDDMSHETFTLNRLRNDDSWDFCKTARKPYDLVVCAILLLAMEIAPGALDVASDGKMSGEDWQPARELLGKLQTKFVR